MGKEETEEENFQTSLNNGNKDEIANQNGNTPNQIEDNNDSSQQSDNVVIHSSENKDEENSSNSFSANQQISSPPKIILLIIYNKEERLLEIPYSIIEEIRIEEVLVSLFAIPEPESSHYRQLFFVNWDNEYQRESFLPVINSPSFLQSIPREFHTELRMFLYPKNPQPNSSIDNSNNIFQTDGNNYNNNENNSDDNNTEDNIQRGAEWQDNQYFTEYAEMRIHTQMLADTTRNEAYYNAISHSDYFKDKVVLDIGTGSSVLSCFAAKAGAKKVYAIEASEMWEKADLVVRRNGFQDVIKIIHGMMEEIELPEQVDIIISEWMGAFLVFESMLNSVVFGRDRWLKPGGVLLPSKARMFLAPITRSRFFDKYVNNLRNICSVSLSPLIPFVQEELTLKIRKAVKIEESDVISMEIKIAEFDIQTVTEEELRKISSNFSFSVNKESVFHGFTIWFEVEFPSFIEDQKPITLTNSPFHPITHWKHDCFLIDEGIPLTVGEKIEGTVILSQNKHWKRHYEAEFSFDAGKTSKYKQFCS